MSGGSVEPEDETDVRCDHCCRYYRTDGIHAHEASCPLKEADVVVLAPDEHDDLVARAEGSGGLGETPGTPRSDPSTSSVEATPAPEAEGADPSSPVDTGGVATDGGRVDPPTFSRVDDAPDQRDDGPTEPECPHCGEAAERHPQDLDPSSMYRCDCCGKRVEGTDLIEQVNA